MMKVVITGAEGQLGRELQYTAPILSCQIIPLSKKDLDVTSLSSVRQTLKSFSPDFVINTAAYTDVDKAESEKEKAFAVNSEGAATLALVSKELGSRLIHLSTDYVFDGKKTQPYLPEDSTEPLNIYGMSKREGEVRIKEIYPENSTLIRTSRVYSNFGNNFVKTILRLLYEKEEISIVSDQISTPTWGRDLAKVIWSRVERRERNGVFHWTNSGVASWYDFAVAIQEEAFYLKLLSKIKNIFPIRALDYPTPAKRPCYSVLGQPEGERFLSQHWRDALRKMLAQ